MSRSIKVFITENEDFFSDLVKEVLVKDEQLEFAGRAYNGKELLNKLSQMARAVLPDVILMDIMMPEMDGIAALTKVKEDYPFIKVLMLTAMDGDPELNNCLQRGADGYLSKRAINKSQFIESIKGIYSGAFVVLKPKGEIVPPLQKVQLKQLEINILGLIAMGKKTRDIARIIFDYDRRNKGDEEKAISRVEARSGKLREQLRAKNSPHAVYIAMKNHILDSFSELEIEPIPLVPADE